jgi:pyruvyltransferase
VESSVKQITRNILKCFRKDDHRYLYWPKYNIKNFGDWLGPYFYRKFTGREPIHREPSNRHLTTTFLTAGSIADRICEDSVVWGSGIISRQDRFWRPWRTHAVRGPHTRARFLELGYPCPEVYGDPGILLPEVYTPGPSIYRYPLGIVPHFVDYKTVETLFANNDDIKIIDVTKPIESVVDAIVSCSRIVSSSLHGLLVAHSYQIPAGWVKFSDRITGDQVKFLDYLASGSIFTPLDPLHIQATMPLQKLIQYVDDFPQPDIEPLREPLLAVCPFLTRN